VAARIYMQRDIGAGLLAGRDSARPNLRLLGSPTAQALREESTSLAIWVFALAAAGLVVGLVSKSINSGVISASMEREFEKFGVAKLASPLGYVSFAFTLFVPAIAAFVCTQVAAARREEEEERLETLLALPVGRSSWLGGRLVLALGGAVLLALVAALATWIGAELAGVGLSLTGMVEGGVNCLPAAVLFLGIATLLFALWPRAGVGVAYGLLAVAYLWFLFGSLVSVPKWVINATPFAHVASVPIEPLRGGAALVMVALGVLAASLGVARFVRRDLLGA
jgi:ABC-2 type transport system permease protein